MPPTWSHRFLEKFHTTSSRPGVLQPLRFWSSHTRLRIPFSVPERTRKLPNTREAFGLQRWQRSILTGLALGILVAPGWWLYEKNKARDPFTAYNIVRKVPVSSTASVFYLAPADKTADLDSYKAAWKRGIWNVHIKQPQLQIVRPYTPLPAFADENYGLPPLARKSDEYLRLLIRRERVGEVSNYIHNLPIGAQLELRGPNLEYALPENTREVIFLAGGTGIAPALQVAQAMFGDSKQQQGRPTTADRKLHILWANRRREDCIGGESDTVTKLPSSAPWARLFIKELQTRDGGSGGSSISLIVGELKDLKRRYPEQITVDYYVNDEDTWLDADAVQNALRMFDVKSTSAGQSSDRDERQIIISGPPGFVSYLAGPREWRNGKEEQGPLGKLLAHALSKTSQEVKVWKV